MTDVPVGCAVYRCDYVEGLERAVDKLKAERAAPSTAPREEANMSEQEIEKLISDVCVAAAPKASPDMDGPALKEWREYSKIGQVELAKRAGITQAMVSEIESEKRPFTKNMRRKVWSAAAFFAMDYAQAQERGEHLQYGLDSRIGPIIRAALAERAAPSAAGELDAPRSGQPPQHYIVFATAEDQQRATTILARAPQPEALTQATDLMIRLFLWQGHGHEGIYGDDGEMQCGECRVDYKRDSLDLCVEKARVAALENGLKALAAQPGELSVEQAELLCMDLRRALATAILFMRCKPDCAGGQGNPELGPICECGAYQARHSVQGVLDRSRP